MRTIRIFDTTLRDGSQSPGASMNLQEKLEVAMILESMGVDIIEAGFPASSKGDSEAVKRIARVVKNSVVCGLCRAVESDIKAVAEAIKPAKRGRIHTFIATSPIHMKYKLQLTPEEVLAKIEESVKFARNFTSDVEWSAEDAARSDINFLCKCVELAIRSGATTINIPDTVGYAIPEEFANIIKSIRNRVLNIDKAVISVHCHNDLGLAVANSLAAIDAGAGQVECTINGIGERAGNAALEEIVMALKTRKDVLSYRTNIKTENIMKASRLVSAITGFAVQPNKAIVGANAFAHEAGIHQDGMLKNAETYEIMTPESVGLNESKIVLGKHSGKHAFRVKLEELGYCLDEEDLTDSFIRFKELADAKKSIYDEDLIALVGDEIFRYNDHIRLEHLEVVCGTQAPKATLTLLIGISMMKCESTGDGPVDAVFTAIKQLTQMTPHLQFYNVKSVTAGTDAQAEVTVRLEEDGRTVNGQGVDTDTLVASAKAYINALNKLYVKREKIAFDALKEASI